MLRSISAILICSTALLAQSADTTVTARTAPRIIRQAPPEYSEEARLAGVSGKVAVLVIVGSDGSLKSFRVVHGVGFGLDEMAEKAVRQWQFKPGEKDGVPVSAPLTLDVNFGLLTSRANFGPASLIFAKSPASTRPVLIKLPEKLADKGQQDEPVVLEIEVDAGGNCKVAGVISGLSSDADAISKNVERWRFQPAMLDGNAVVTRGRLTFLMGKAEEVHDTESKFSLGEEDAFRPSSSVSRPTLLRQVQPDYSEEARKAGVSGTIVARIVVGADGTVRSARVIHRIGFGLDEKAVESVRKWQFQPGKKDGVPVPVIAMVEVNFRLFSKRPDFGPNALVFALAPGVNRPELLSLPSKVKDDGTDRDPVVLDLEVNTDGKCRVTAVVHGGDEDADAVTKNVEKWHFGPAELNGSPVAVHGRVRYLLGKKDASFIDAPPAPVH